MTLMLLDSKREETDLTGQRGSNAASSKMMGTNFTDMAFGESDVKKETQDWALDLTDEERALMTREREYFLS